MTFRDSRDHPDRVFNGVILWLMWLGPIALLWIVGGTINESMQKRSNGLVLNSANLYSIPRHTIGKWMSWLRRFPPRPYLGSTHRIFVFRRQKALIPADRLLPIRYPAPGR